MTPTLGHGQLPRNLPGPVPELLTTLTALVFLLAYTKPRAQRWILLEVNSGKSQHSFLLPHKRAATLGRGGWGGGGL